MKKNKYWFKRRRYGLGWTPVTLQGWLVITAYLLSLPIFSFFLLKDIPEDTYHPNVLIYLFLVFIITIILITITYLKGPKPKWRWGKKKTDNPELDY